MVRVPVFAPVIVTGRWGHRVSHGGDLSSHLEAPARVGVDVGHFRLVGPGEGERRVLGRGHARRAAVIAGLSLIPLTVTNTVVAGAVTGVRNGGVDGVPERLLPKKLSFRRYVRFVPYSERSRCRLPERWRP